MEEKQEISIQGRSLQISPEGEEDTLTWDVVGTLQQLQNAVVISYAEGEESGLSGTNTTIKVDKNKVILLRTGACHWEQDFRIKETSSSLYHTPYGIMEMTVTTEERKENISPLKGQLELIYLLEIEGVSMGKVIFEIAWSVI